MKNLAKIASQSSFTAIALAAVIGFIVIACGNGTTGGGGTPSDPTSVTYTSTDGTDTYKLVITKKGSRAAYDPQSGDGYVLTVTGTQNYKSTGTVKSASGGSLSLLPDNSSTPFLVLVVNGEMTEITGTITGDDGNTKTAPGEVQQPNTSTNTDTAINGIWVSPAFADYVYFKFNNGSYESFGVMKGEFHPTNIIGELKGTYTTSDSVKTDTTGVTKYKEITFKPTHVKNLIAQDDKWYSKSYILSNFPNWEEFQVGAVYTLDDYFEVFTLYYHLFDDDLSLALVTDDDDYRGYTKQ